MWREAQSAERLPQASCGCVSWVELDLNACGLGMHDDRGHSTEPSQGTLNPAAVSLTIEPRDPNNKTI